MRRSARLDILNKTMMLLVFEVILTIAAEMASWRVLLCIVVAVGMVAGLYYKFPEQDGLWSISYPAAVIITAMGFWWQHRADR
jgi:uncharacterized integral membrane protein